MPTKHLCNNSRLPTILMMAFILTGCSSYGGGITDNEQITINSDPEGATVLANGTDIGATPVTINPGNHFQASFTSGGKAGGLIVFRYVGTLVVKKPGCKDFSTQVNDNILSKDIDVVMECDPAYQPTAVHPAVSAPAITPAEIAEPAAPEKQSSQTAIDAEERLLRIESLHNKGLLSDKEYKTLRLRIIDTL